MQTHTHKNESKIVSAWILDHYCRRGTKSRPHAGGQTHTHLKVDTCWWAGCLPHSPWGQEYPVCITCAHTHATLSIPQTPAEATNASLLSCLPQSLYRCQEIVWLHTAFIACASLTAWSYKWPSRSRFWWACVHWGTDDAHHAGPGLDPCHEGRTHLWVNSAHPWHS